MSQLIADPIAATEALPESHPAPAGLTAQEGGQWFGGALFDNESDGVSVPGGPSLRDGKLVD